MGLKSGLNWMYDVAFPEVRDFSEEKKQELLEIVDKSDSDFFTRYLGRFLIEIGLARLLDIYHEEIIDYYNYSRSIIESIFDQARDCDRRYGLKLENYANSIQNADILLNELAEALNPKSAHYYPEEVSITDRLDGWGERTINLELYKKKYSYIYIDGNYVNLREDNSWNDNIEDTYIDGGISVNGKMITRDSLNAQLENTCDSKLTYEKVFNFTQDESSDYFKEYSDVVYEDLGIDNSKVKEVEDQEEFDNFCSNISELYDLSFDKSVEVIEDELTKRLGEDSIIYNCVKGFVTATGEVDYWVGYLKVKALSNFEGKLQMEYEKLHEKFIKNKATDEDVERFEKVFEMLKMVEGEIYRTYREMYPLDGAKQVEINSKIDEIDGMHIHN